MRIILYKTTVLLLCLFFFCSCGGKANDPSAPADDAQAQETPVVAVTDDRQTEQTFLGTPKRVAALTGSFAQVWMLSGGTVCATVEDAWKDLNLDLDDSAASLGTSMRVSLELLIDAQPDLIIGSCKTGSHLELCETMEKAGVPSLCFNVNSFGDYLRMLDICTDITGRKDLYEKNGKEIEERINKTIHSAEEIVKEKGSPSVLLIRAAATGIHAKSSDDTVLGEILRDLGCNNIADGNDLLENLSMEKIIEEDPDYIFLVQQGDDTEAMEQMLKETLTGNPAWAGLRAVKEEKLYYMDKNLYHFKPNDRWGEAYEELFSILYGE